MKERTANFKPAAFTLVELLVSMAVLSLLLLVLVQVTSQTSAIWETTTGRASQFREARNAFESITRTLSQATLNTYYDYYNAGGDPRSKVDDPAGFVPARYGRLSELRFRTGATASLLGKGADVYPGHAVFFQAPLGFTSDGANLALENALNTWGYFLQFRADDDRPGFISGASHSRYRLMEFMEPTENLRVYEDGQWLSNAAAVNSAYSHVLASNIVALILLPKLPAQGSSGDLSVDASGSVLAPEYAYDTWSEGEGTQNAAYSSLHQLPPIVEVTMVAIDEPSARRLEDGDVPPDFGLGALFADSRPAQRKADLETLINTLNRLKVNYRVFSTEVSIRGAKWTRD